MSKKISLWIVGVVAIERIALLWIRFAVGKAFALALHARGSLKMRHHDTPIGVPCHKDNPTSRGHQPDSKQGRFPIHVRAFQALRDMERILIEPYLCRLSSTGGNMRRLRKIVQSAHARRHPFLSITG